MKKYIELSKNDSELRYRRLFETSQTGILILDGKTGFIKDVNPFLMEMLNYSREEFINKSLWEMGAFIDTKNCQNAFKELRENKYIRYGDLPLKKKDGSLIQVEFISNEYLVGEKAEIQCNIHDITARKHANKKILYQAGLLDSVNDAIVAMDPQHILTAWNKAAEFLYGWKENEVIGLNGLDLLHTKWPKNQSKQMKRTIARTGRWRGEANQICKDGRRIDVEISSFVHKDVNGEIVGYSSINRDITEQKQSREDLEQVVSQLSNLYNNLPQAIFSIDIVHNKMLQVSQAHEGIFGYPSEEFFKNPNLWHDIIIPEDKARVTEEIATLQTVKFLKQEFRIIRPDGNLRWIESTMKPTIDEKGKLIRVDGIALDITDRKLSEQTIQRHIKYLTAINSIDRFIAGNFDLTLNLSEILRHAIIDLGVDAADILLLDSNLNILECAADRGFRSKVIQNTHLTLGESYAGQVALKRQIIEILNLQNEPVDNVFSVQLAEDNFSCYWGVPLIAKGKVNGVLEVFNRSSLKPDADWYDFLNTLAFQAAIAIENANLFNSMQRSNLEISMAYDATIEGWSHALDLRDKETEGHSQRVTEMTVKLAEKFGFSKKELVQIRWGALLHDIGKMGIPDQILLKPGPLTDDEWIMMKKHPAFAYDLLSPIKYLHKALDIPYSHHEKWDGSGYPLGLSGLQIPMVARIFAVVDVWDALSSDSPYRPAWPKEQVFDYLLASSGTHFDPQVLEEFLKIYSPG
ncbi:MAG: PAS domain S-box protein [Anaerolineaceae bacterium]|nr:PAS domain S-box protein [Anaerolineaceae bacterium]